MTQTSTFRAWLQLIRVANLPTAISNVVAGCVLTSFDIDNGNVWYSSLPGLAVVTAMLYCAGMILNDAYDAEIDAVERPARPIPSGRIERNTAFLAGFACLGIAIAIPAGVTIQQVLVGAALEWRQPVVFLIVTLALAMNIVLYDGFFKQTALAPLLMGSCRTFNILLGGSMGAIFLGFGAGAFAVNQHLFGYAGLVGMFVLGITLLARSETKRQQSRRWLAAGAVTMSIALIGMAWLQAFPKLSYGEGLPPTETRRAYAVFVGVISIPIIRRLIIAVRLATPAAVGNAIVTSLTSLIFLDAAVCFLTRPDQPIIAALVASLALMVVALRRWSQQT